MLLSVWRLIKWSKRHPLKWWQYSIIHCFLFLGLIADWLARKGPWSSLPDLIVWNNLKLQAKYPIQFVSFLQVSSWKIKLIRRTRKYRINLKKLDLTFIKKSECLSDFIVDSRHYLFKMNKVNTIIEHFSGRISIIFSIIQFSEKKTERNVRLQISAPI